MRARRLVPGRFTGRRLPAPACPAVPGAARWRGRRIGLLGGSFNPAHEGHRAISLEALKRLRLDDVWWLVSPQNPLKPDDGMAPVARRLARAREMARHPRIHVTDLEARLGTRRTADTLERLGRAVPGAQFVWIMGADNLVQLPRWYRWRAVVEAVPLAIMDRTHYSLKGLNGTMATRYRSNRMPPHALTALATSPAPIWAFVTFHRHPASATEIRERRGAHSRRGRNEARQGKE